MQQIIVQRNYETFCQFPVNMTLKRKAFSSTYSIYIVLW